MAIIDEKQESNFYMSFYIMDSMCRGHNFPSMNWEWKGSSPLVHIYYLELWEARYKYDYENTYNNFLAPLRTFVTCQPTSCISQDAMDVVSKTGDWYVSYSRVYFHIHGSMKALHQLPHYILDRIMLLKIVYQTYVWGFEVAMTRKKIITWIKLPLQVGCYKIEIMKQVVAETEIFGVYQLGALHFYRHHPKGTIKNFLSNPTSIGSIHMKHVYMKKSTDEPLHYKRLKPNWGKSERILSE